LLATPADQVALPRHRHREFRFERVDVPNGHAPLDLLLLEVRDAHVANLAFVSELGHGAPGLLDRDGLAFERPPMQEVEIDPVGLQALKAGIAGSPNLLGPIARPPAACLLVRGDLRRDEDLIAPAEERFPDESASEVPSP
jgi:hypothetical protein